MKLTIDSPDQGQRLDLWLGTQLKISRSQAQKMIKDNLVSSDNKLLNSHHQLKLGETIVIKKPSAEEKKIVKLKKIIKPKIIFETADYLVIDKPAGLLMHGTANDQRYSLVDWLVVYYPPIAKVGEDPTRPGIIQRLDKDVSGLVVIAKTQKSFDDLKKQFQERTVLKKYQALVFGDDLPEEEEIRFRLERSAKGYRMAARPLNQLGKLAITKFNILKRFYNYTLLNVVIKTGRTHQIRASLAAYNHPVVGDDLYGGVKQKTVNKKLKLGRVFLVATDLEFTDLAGQQQSFSIPLPSKLKLVLKGLKIKNPSPAKRERG